MPSAIYHYRVTSNLNAYYVTVHDGEFMARVHVGGTNRAQTIQKHCMIMTVYKDQTDKDNRYAHLEGISYRPLCAIGGNLQRSEGTRDLMKTGLAVLFNLQKKY